MFYDSSSCQLIVTVVSAVDLPSRDNGQPRNPYCKLYLLPERSEKSKRRTKTVAGTLEPKWNQTFVYSPMKRADIRSQSLQITVYDYDRIGSGEYVGETVIELNSADKHDRPQWYALRHHDDTVGEVGSSSSQWEGYTRGDPTSYTKDHLSPPTSMNRLSDSDVSEDGSLTAIEYGCHGDGATVGMDTLQRRSRVGSVNGRSRSCSPSRYQRMMGTGVDQGERKRQLPRIPLAGSHANIGRVTQELEERARMLKLKLKLKRPDIGLPLSDSEVSQQLQSYGRRHGSTRHSTAERFESDPEAQTARREAWTSSGGYGSEFRHGDYGSGQGTMRSRSQEQRDSMLDSVYGYGGGGGGILPEMRSYSRSQTILLKPDSGAPGYLHQSDYGPRTRDRGRDVFGDPDRLRRDRHHNTDRNFSNRRDGDFNPDDEMAMQSDASEMSDMSVSKYSVRSTQSEKPSRHYAMEQQVVATRYSRQDRGEPSREVAPQQHVSPQIDGNDGSISDSALSFSLTEGRRKRRSSIGDKVASLVGLSRNKSNSASHIPPNDAKRGRNLFKRNDDVSRPTDSRNHVGRHSDHRPKRSGGGYEQDEMFSNMEHEGYYGDFIEGLGPSQMVGRQVLGLPCMGEIQLSIADRKGQLEVEVIRARELVAKPGAKVLPAPYIKVYLMDGKNCVEKQKTVTARRTLDPLYQQQLCFSEPYNARILQVTVWGDYGRSDRKVFMGVAQIKLDDLDLSSMAIGWYKLFTNSSLVNAGMTPSGEPSSQKNPSLSLDDPYRSGLSRS